MYELPRFYGLEKRSDLDRRQFVRVLSSAGYDPVGIGAVIQMESARSWDPSKKGPAGAFSMAPGYPVGLIQFAPQTARTLGTSTAALERMSFVEQLPYVVKYYDGFGGPSKFNRPGDYYLAGWGARPETSDGVVLATRENDVKKRYFWNSSLDTNKDGKILASELRGLVNRTIAAARERGVYLVDETAPLPSMSPSGVSSSFGMFSACAIALSSVVLFWGAMRNP